MFSFTDIFGLELLPMPTPQLPGPSHRARRLAWMYGRGEALLVKVVDVDVDLFNSELKDLGNKYSVIVVSLQNTLVLCLCEATGSLMHIRVYTFAVSTFFHDRSAHAYILII